MAQAVLVADPQEIATATAMVADSLAAVNLNLHHVDVEPHKKNRIQVSNTKKPLFFYLNLTKRYLKQHNEVELSALGMAIPTVVTISEILKANGVAVERKVITSTVDSKDETKGRIVQKAKIEIVLTKTDKSPTSTNATPKSVLKTESNESELKKEAEKAEKMEG